MAVRFHRGGKLLVFGAGGAAADAEHVAVEFTHPVVVGKRALPAMCLPGAFAERTRLFGRPDDIALGISADGHCADVLEALREARATGMETVALLGGDGGAIAASGAARHVLIARSGDPRVVKEVHVTAYHILWELVHVFFDQPGTLEGEAAR
jgi:D-sedoheptulose 7-phosphate isomerase